MALKRVGVELEAQQSAAFLKAIENANAAVADFGTAAIRASTGVDKFDTSTRQLKIDDLERKLAGQAQALAILERELDQTAVKYGESSIQADKKRLAISNLNRSISSNEQALESQKTALNNAIQAEIRAEQAIQNVGTETAQATTKINKLGTEVLQSAQQSERGFKDIGQAADRANDQVGMFEQIVTGGLRRVGAAAVDLSIQGGQALVGLVGDTLSAVGDLAGDFEATLNNFSSKTGSAMEEAGFDLQDFSAEFLRLGAETKFSAAEAGDAAVELAKGGVSVTDIMGEATEATLNLAAATDLELAPAAEIVAKQLGFWGDEGITATEIVDSLAQAANASSVDADELAAGLLQAGKNAKASGADFDELVTAMALLAPGFGSSEEAGTSLSNFFARIIPTTKGATDAMKDLGLFTDETGSAFYDASGSFIGLEESAELLQKATEELTEEQRNLYFQTIFGNDAMGAANILAHEGATGFRAMAAAQGLAGSALDQATKMNIGFNFAMESLSGSLDTVKIKIGTVLLPILTAFVETAVIPAVNAISDFVTALSTSNDPMGMIVEQLKLGAIMLSTWVIDAIPSVIGGLASLGSALIEWTISMLPTWSAAMLELGKQAVQWISDSLPGWQAAAGEYLNQIINWVQASLPGWIENLKTFGAAAAQWIADSAPGWLAKASELFNAMIAWITASMPGWIEELKKFANAAIQWVIDSLPELGTNLGIFAGAILAWVVKTTAELIPVIAGLAWEFIKWIGTDVVPKLPAALLAIATAIGGFIIATAKAVVPELLLLAKEFYAWIEGTAIPELGKALPKIWTAITDWITQAAKDVYTAVLTIGTNIITGITKGVTDAALGLLNAVLGAVTDAWNAVGEFLGIQSPSKLYHSAGENMMLGMTEGVKALENKVVFSVVSAMTVTADAAKLIAMSGGIAAGSTFAENLATSMHTTAIDEATSGGLATGSSFADSFQRAIDGAFNTTIQSGISDALGMLVGQSAQGGWLAGGAFASAYQSAISGLSGGGSLIEMPSLTGGFSSGNTSTTNNSASYAINYSGVANPPPPSQSFAAMAAWAG